MAKALATTLVSQHYETEGLAPVVTKTEPLGDYTMMNPLTRGNSPSAFTWVKQHRRRILSFDIIPMPTLSKAVVIDHEAMKKNISDSFDAGVFAADGGLPPLLPETPATPATYKRRAATAPGPAEWTMMKRARKEAGATDTQVVFICDSDLTPQTTPNMGTNKKNSGRTGTTTKAEAIVIMDAMRDMTWLTVRNIMCNLFDVGVTGPAMIYLRAHRDEFNTLLTATSSHLETRQLSAVSAVLAVLLDQHARQAIVTHPTFPKRDDDGKMRLAVVTMNGLKDADTKSDTRRLSRQHRPTSIASFPVQTAMVFSACLSLPQLPNVLHCSPIYYGAVRGVEPGIWVSTGAIRVPVITTLLTVTTASFGQGDGASAITTRLKAARKVGAAGTVNFQQTLFRSQYCEKAQGRRLHMDTTHRSPAQDALRHYVRFLRAIHPIMTRCMVGFFEDDGCIRHTLVTPVAYDFAEPQSQAMALFLSKRPTSVDM